MQGLISSLIPCIVAAHPDLPHPVVAENGGEKLAYYESEVPMCKTIMCTPAMTDQRDSHLSWKLICSKYAAYYLMKQVIPTCTHTCAVDTLFGVLLIRLLQQWWRYGF